MSILLVDGQPLLYRAASSYPGLRSNHGPTGVIAGAIALLEQMVKTQKPEAMIVFWDESGVTWRKERFEGYKASRALRAHALPVSMESVREQALEVRRLLAMSGIVQVYQAGVEADDLIALASDALSQHELVIASSDRDFFQLLRPGLEIYDPVSKRGFTHQQVEADMGCDLSRWVDHAALSGAAGDDIPHPPGIGPAKALHLIQKYPSLEAIWEDTGLAQSKQGWVRSLVGWREQTLLARELILLPTFARLGGLGPRMPLLRARTGHWSQPGPIDIMNRAMALDYHALKLAGGQLSRLPVNNPPLLDPFWLALGQDAGCELAGAATDG